MYADFQRRVIQALVKISFALTKQQSADVAAYKSKAKLTYNKIIRTLAYACHRRFRLHVRGSSYFRYEIQEHRAGDKKTLRPPHRGKTCKCNVKNDE